MTKLKITIENISAMVFKIINRHTDKQNNVYVL